MKKYIDKTAIKEEIERRMKEHHSGYLVCLKDILSFLDTLEVKEVDLDDKDKWKNTGGFGSTWDPDSPDYYPD